MLQAIAKRRDTIYFSSYFTLPTTTPFAPPLPYQCFMDFEMSIKVTRSNIERGRGVWRANKALISFQQAALTRKSDFPWECLSNFANACLVALPLYSVGG